MSTPVATHGRTRSGWPARREAALKVLTDLAGLSALDLAELTVADITVVDGTATITTPTRTITITPTTEGICGPCTLARWLHTLDLGVVHPDPLVVNALVTRAAAPTPHPPDACTATATTAPGTRSIPLLPRVDTWGLIPHQHPNGARRTPRRSATTR
jgi:hypothetical protein